MESSEWLSGTLGKWSSKIFTFELHLSCMLLKGMLLTSSECHKMILGKIIFGHHDNCAFLCVNLPSLLVNISKKMLWCWKAVSPNIQGYCSPDTQPLCQFNIQWSNQCTNAICSPFCEFCTWQVIIAWNLYIMRRKKTLPIFCPSEFYLILCDILSLYICFTFLFFVFLKFPN